jgi:hypothetical protein
VATRQAASQGADMTAGGDGGGRLGDRAPGCCRRPDRPRLAINRRSAAPIAVGRRAGLMSIHQRAVRLLGQAVPPSRSVPGRGRPRTQVELSSLGSGRPPNPSEPAPTEAAGLPPSELTAAEWAALQQLADASHPVVARWPVGRAIALALIRRGLVHGCSEWVWLTQAGHQALGAAPARQPIHTPHPQPDSTADRTTRPASRTARTDRRAARQPQPTRPVGRPAGGELPPGVLLRASRLARTSHP